jgi:GlpG protein
MRQAGTLSNREQAERLCDYLLTQGISAKADADGDSWAIWIHDEDQLPKAKALLQEFQADPNSAKYRSAAQTAESLRKQQARDDEQRRKNVIELRNRWGKSSGPRPLTMVLIGVSVLVTLATNFGKDFNEIQQAVMFQSLENDARGQLGAPGQIHDIFEGQIWRLVTPIFLHFRILHLVFNMFWLYDLGAMVEGKRGTLRYGLLVLAIAVLSNYGEYFIPEALNMKADGIRIFGGMSGVNYGLFGYIWMKSQFDPLSGMRLSGQTVFIMLLWFVVCWIGVVGSIANWAHTVGLVVGIIIGYAPIAWQKLTKR